MLGDSGEGDAPDNGNNAPALADVSLVYISIQLFNLSSEHLIQLAAQRGAKDLPTPQKICHGCIKLKEDGYRKRKGGNLSLFVISFILFHLNCLIMF